MNFEKISTVKGYFTESFKAQWLLHDSPQFNIKKFYLLPTRHIHVFCIDLGQSNSHFCLQY